MVLRDGARFIVLLCQPLGLAARTAPLLLLVSSLPVCANVMANVECVVPVCANAVRASVPVCAIGATIRLAGPDG
jgi:hypothetical protein